MQTVTHSNVPVLSLREIHRDDVPMVSELAARVWRKHYAPDIVSMEQIEYMIPRTCSEAAIINGMNEKKQRGWMVFDGPALSGYTIVESRAPGTIFIDKLYVDIPKQRTGYGTALLQHVIKELHPKELALRVNRRNFSALNFYFKHGFIIEALHTLDIGGGYVMDDFLMKKTG